MYLFVNKYFYCRSRCQRDDHMQYFAAIALFVTNASNLTWHGDDTEMRSLQAEIISNFSST